MKYILLLLLVASILTIDNPAINKIRGQLIEVISNIAHSEYGENNVSDAVSAEIKSFFNTFNTKEEEFILPYLGSPTGLLKFHKDYCEHGGFYNEMADQNRRKVCLIIDKQLDAIENEALRNN